MKQEADCQYSLQIAVPPLQFPALWAAKRAFFSGKSLKTGCF
jgi:hypothetical protein